MNKFIITYDLNKEGENYNKAKNEVEAAIKGLSNRNHSVAGIPVPAADKLTTTTWIIETTESLDDVYGKIRNAMDDNDELVVGEIGEYRPNPSPKGSRDKGAIRAFGGGNE